MALVLVLGLHHHLQSFVQVRPVVHCVYKLWLPNTVVTCPVLTPPTNGTLSTTSRDYLTVVTYSCDTGYVLTGNSGSARTCKATGLWSGEVETCPRELAMVGWK